MSAVKTEIAGLEEQLRLAELGPDPAFFEKVLADDCVLVGEHGDPFAKPQVVAAHQPGQGPKFTRVEMKDMAIVDHGVAAVVTCRGTFEGPGVRVMLTFMRVWLRKDEGWQIIAGSVTN